MVAGDTKIWNIPDRMKAQGLCIIPFAFRRTHNTDTKQSRQNKNLSPPTRPPHPHPRLNAETA